METLLTAIESIYWTAGAHGVLILLLLQGLVILSATLLIVHLTMRKPIKEMTEWLRRVRSGAQSGTPELPRKGLVAALGREAATLARSLSDAQASAEHEARLRVLSDPLWTAGRLREHVRAKLGNRPLVVLSNREPYRHERQGRGIGCVTPASGLVTGLEPLLRACGGTWVAHGDGDADRETADLEGRLKVPPDQPQYVLKRVWLNAAEENGYYYGFSNEGLWPLCHIAHTRPLFRPEDWVQYQEVNAKFAQAVLKEVEFMEEPFLLIQDYHFTLVPSLIKEKRPDARVALFWHIPWPNPEAFGICPWQKEILSGMLGADLIGFHTQFHCNNFLETVDRTLESRIDRERFAVKRGGHSTMVKPFPISVEFPEPSPGLVSPHPKAERENLLKEFGISPEFVAVGVDRVDYTKGIIERFKAVERFLETNPLRQGRFTLFQIGAPSRVSIGRYRDLNGEIEAEARRINERFKSKGAPPIMLLLRHHTHEEILPFYRAADLCLVTALHDGMNLVAKEFVAARSDELGVLILSRFTGAARELRDALIINPYDIEAVSEAIRAGLEMAENEQALRMGRLRRVVRENNIYRWAGSIIEDLAAVRLPAALVETRT